MFDPFANRRVFALGAPLKSLPRTGPIPTDGACSRAAVAGARGRGAIRWAGLLLALLCMLAPGNVVAGDFTINWGTAPYTWPANGLGPYTYTLNDQYGFQLDARMSITRFGGFSVNGYPNDLVGFGTNTSIWVVYDSANGNSGIGESTNTATLEFLSGGAAFAVDALAFQITDIDTTDNNNNTDRCDFVTVTGDNGNPALTYVHPIASQRSVIIGPGAGSGSTGAIAANQAQCIYNLGPTGSNTSNGDDFGSILATFPAGTSVATVAYDESIENVYGVTSRNAAARGVGVWGASAITVDNAISLQKSTPTVYYTAAGQVITYTYVVTNNGPLPFNTGQNIWIQDDRIGTFTCGTISASVPSGGTVSCTADYTVTAGDMSATEITNTATAGIGTGAQSFATRLQSNSDQATVLRYMPSVAIDKSVDQANISALTTLNWTILVTNTGNAILTSPSLSDQLLQGAANRTLTSGPTYVSGDTDSDGIIDVGEAWAYSATYAVTQIDLDDGGDLVNTATIATAEVADESDNAVTTITQSPALAISKTADDTTDVSLGQVITYTYVVTNTGNITIDDVNIAEAHGGSGPPPAPAGETLSNDVAPLLDSSDTTADNGVWSTLAPGDSVSFTGTYTVTQLDIDSL